MTRRFAAGLALILGALIWVDAPAQSQYHRISGDDVEKRTRRVLENIHWYRDLGEALEVSKREQKPLMWLQMVGDLDGGL